MRPLFLEEIADNGIARITLTRPDFHNAFNDTLILELTSAFRGLQSDERVRAIVLAAQGKSFSAGADLNWMQAIAEYDEDRNLEDARALANLLWTLDRSEKPTLALVQGPAFGGGVGLIACCDIVVAAEEAIFSLSEVRLGLIPATISPYLLAKVGLSAARRYILTGERFSAWEAQRIGLVHEVVDSPSLEQKCREILDALLSGGPRAITSAKRLLFDVAGRPLDKDLRDETAKWIAKTRASVEAREGLAAFLAKRPPNWRPR